jgi:hypothetical protein
MIRRIFFSAVLTTLTAGVGRAQFSSDIPGVPRASISIRGGHQNRTEWTFTGYKVPNAASSGDTIAGGLRLGFGQSYRVLGQFELGYDLTLFDAYALQPPSIKTADAKSTSEPTYMRGIAAYGIRIGAKYRPVVALDPDGNGYEVAFGAAIQPELQPLYGIEHMGDSSRQGGQFSHDNAATSSTVFRSNPFAKLSSAVEAGAMGSYRARRITGDAALLIEHVPERNASTDPSPVSLTDGLSLRVGGAFRLTPSISVGGSYWSKGAGPWRDDIRLAAPGKHQDDHFAFLLQFGSEPEAGIDLMYSRPTGKYSESGRLYLRMRSTR